MRTIIEIWRDIKGWEGEYQVSNLSQVKSLYRKIVAKDGSLRTVQGGILIQMRGKVGYMTVGLSRNRRTKFCKIHRLVAEAFIPNPMNKSQVNHKNGVKTDNRISNLEWATPRENTRHAINTNLRRPHKKGEGYWVGKIGLLNPRSKKIIQVDIVSDEELKIFDSIMDVERELGLLHGNIGRACRNEKFSCGGFKWRYLK